MWYVARLVETPPGSLKLEKPVQKFGADLAVLRVWANEAVQTHKGRASVEIAELKEFPIETVAYKPTVTAVV